MKTIGIISDTDMKTNDLETLFLEIFEKNKTTISNQNNRCFLEQCIASFILRLSKE